MKRNSSFMLAYIIFLAVCVVIRSFVEFPLWPALVAAITTASWIIALADFKYTIASELHLASKETSELAEAAIEDIQRILNTIDRILAENENIKKEELAPADQKRIEYCEKTKTKVLDSLENYKKRKLAIRNLKDRADKREKQGKVLTVVGFVAFFIILAFEPITKWFIDDQDVMTVGAFAIILYTQHEDEAIKEKRKNIRVFYDELNSEQEALRKSFELEVLHRAD